MDFNELKESNEFLINERLILEESLGEAEQKLKQLTQKKEELERHIEDLKKTEYQTPDLSTLHFHKIENENLKNELEFKKQEISKYRSDLNVKQELIGQLNRQLEEKESKIDSLKKQIDEYDRKLSRIEDEYKDKISQLQNDYLAKDEQYNVLVSKYIKHRKIWEENYDKATFEVKKLDEVIDNVIATLKSKIDIVGQVPEIRLLLDQLTTDQWQVHRCMNSEISEAPPRDFKRLCRMPSRYHQMIRFISTTLKLLKCNYLVTNSNRLVTGMFGRKCPVCRAHKFRRSERLQIRTNL